MVVCIHFSKRSEADFFYKSVVTERKLWLLKEYGNHCEVILEASHMNGSTYVEIVRALLDIIRVRKLLGWMEGVLRHRYYYEDQQEIQQILEIGREFEDKVPEGMSLPPIHQYIKIFIQDYITTRTFIDFDELSADCLRSVHECVIEYTGKLIDEYKQEEAYQLLLDSWRYRVHNRDTGVQLMHLIQNEGLTYFHDEGNPVSKSETLLYMKQYPDDSIQDLPLQWCLTPALVHAPDYLVIYTDHPSDPQLELIMNIFEEKAICKPQSEFPFKIS